MNAYTKADAVRIMRSIMDARGWSAAGLARAAGVAPSTITRGLNVEGPFVPSMRTMSKIVQVGREALQEASSLIVNEQQTELDQWIRRQRTRFDARVPMFEDIDMTKWRDISTLPTAVSGYITLGYDHEFGDNLRAFRVTSRIHQDDIPEGSIVICDAKLREVVAGDRVVVRIVTRTIVNAIYINAVLNVEASSAGKLEMVMTWLAKPDPRSRFPLEGVTEASKGHDETRALGRVVGVLRAFKGPGPRPNDRVA